MRTKIVAAAAVAALLACGAASIATPANALVVCNRFNECWHARQRWAFPPRLGVVYYADGWRFPGPGYRWRANRYDRGYWWRGQWRRF